MAATFPDWRALTRPQLEAALLNEPDLIDFGPGLQIASTQFVGVRDVGSGIVVEAPKPASHHHGVTELFKGILGARRASQETDLNGRFGDGKANSGSHEFRPQDCCDTSVADTKRSGTIVDPPNGDLGFHFALCQGNDGGSELLRREEVFQPDSPALDNGAARDLHTWEVVWKEGKAGGPLRRLKFVTSESGYKLIRDKLDAWVSASHTSMAMNEAARAALDACGGHLKENPGHQHGVHDMVVPRHMDGEAVDHSDLHMTSFGLDTEAETGTLAEETYLHKQQIIDMQSIPLQGKIHPHCDSRSSILQDGHIMAIAAVLPLRFRSYNWTLLYSTYRDGISLNTLYRKVHMNGPTILVIRDWDKKIFGCYASEEWKVAGRSYGNGECFVFQVVPDMKAYKWTRENHLFMFSNLDMLAIGGGDHYSLLLNSDLLTGYSGACETFGSPSLTSSEEFTVSAVEVWGFQ